VVGLVGPAGSGKSTLARALEGPKTLLLDADRMGHQIANHNPEVRAALIAEYGPAVYRRDGGLDRAHVAARVFSDPAALARLNALMHPRIVEWLLASIGNTGYFQGTVLVDAALLLDWGFEKECHAVIAVTAPRQLQLERLRKSRGWDDAEVARRLAVARSNAEFEAAADKVVENDASEAEAVATLRFAIQRLYKACVDAAGRGRGGFTR
jgi:dephospho-CoA kinase